MRQIRVFTPTLDTFVLYKILDTLDVDEFVSEHQNVDRDTYIRSVMEVTVANLRTDVRKALKTLNKPQARKALGSIYNACVMLNPGFDVDTWLEITESRHETAGPEPIVENQVKEQSQNTTHAETESNSEPKHKKLSKTKFLALDSALKSKIIGQNEAIETVSKTLKRSVVGLSDPERPIGVFLFSGASGIGKTLLAKELHKNLFDAERPIVRVDCGEFQQKHENQKLLGAPMGYIGHDEEGSTFSKQMRGNPNTVLLLDEVEKAHPDLWDTFLRIFDEGTLTDSAGNEIYFHDSLIIMTTNLGNKDILKNHSNAINRPMGFTALEDITAIPARDQVVQKTEEDLRQIVALEMDEIQRKLARRKIVFNYTDELVTSILENHVDFISGARGISKYRREVIEDRVSDVLLSKARWPKGTVITASLVDGDCCIEYERPQKSVKTS